MKPNGLFSIGKRSLDYEYDENDSEDLIHVLPEKRQTFWATRGKREPEMFWAQEERENQATSGQSEDKFETFSRFLLK